MTDVRIGKPGNLDNRVSVIRITGNQKTDDRLRRAVHRMANGKDSKISAKYTPKPRFNVPTNLFYNCRESSTNRPYFMQNKANFRKGQIYASSIITNTYGNESAFGGQENKANQSQLAKSSNDGLPFLRNDRGAERMV